MSSLTPTNSSEPRHGAVRPSSGKPGISVFVSNDAASPADFARAQEIRPSEETANAIIGTLIDAVLSPRSEKAIAEMSKISSPMCKMGRNPLTGNFDVLEAYEALPDFPQLVLIDGAVLADTVQVNGRSLCTISLTGRLFQRISDPSAVCNEVRFYFSQWAADADKLCALCDFEVANRSLQMAMDYAVNLCKRNRHEWATFLKSQSSVLGHRLTLQELDEARFKQAATAAGLPDSTPAKA